MVGKRKAIRHTQEYVAGVFRNHGCELLSEYHARDIPVEYRCVCGRLAKITFGAFRVGQRCRGCFTDRCSGSNHYNWNPDRDRVKLNEQARVRYYSMIHNVLRATGKKKKTKSREMLGYDVRELFAHIESHPNWPTVRDGNWHIDHIFPVTAFLDYGITDPAIINCLENLQPMAEFDNLSKCDNYDRKEFEEWLVKKSWLVVPTPSIS